MGSPLDEMTDGILSMVSRMDAHEPSDLDGKPIEPGQFLPIKDREPSKIAFVDGGNKIVDRLPSFTTSLNRVCFTMYEGERRIEPKDARSAEFFSLTEFAKRQDRTIAETRLFHRADDKHLMPNEDDLAIVIHKTEQRAVAEYRPRKFAEWKLATSVAIDELGSGDILVIDGSLQTGSEKETNYAHELYNMASSKGITLCGLSKTSRVMTEAGHLLLPPIRKAGLKALGRAKWWVPVGAQKGGGDDKGYSMVVRLHEDSDYVFRLEILKEQYDKETADRVASSLASNSRDSAIPGYPYGAIEADSMARVRSSYARAARNTLLAGLMSHPEWREYERNARAVDMHDRLNLVA